MTQPTYDAIIVGFGPVGATLANLLARRGLRLAVVEAERELYDKPRAITFDHEAMRIFQACGLAQRIAPHTAPHPGTHFLGADGHVIKKFEPLPPPHPLGWPPTSTFVQPEVERVLREGAAAYAHVDVFLGQRGAAFTQHDAGVTLTALDSASGKPRVLGAKVLLGCDGANSFVRKQLAIELEDLAFDEWWMVVDAHIRAPLDLPPRCVQYCWPSRPATYIQGPGTLRRWEIKLLPGEDSDAFGRDENVERQLARFADVSCLAIWRAAVYRFHALLAQRWRHGRVFLLGDACHQTPPFLGQGLCAGLRDAANLAWKLERVLQQGAPQALLDTYEAERKPHVRALVARAKEFGQIIGELDIEAARLRDETLRGQLERGEAETIRQRFIPDLASGVIDQGGEARGAGTLFVQPRVRLHSGGEALLDDLLDARFLFATTTRAAQSWLSGAALELWQRVGGRRIVIERLDSLERSVAPENAVERFIETGTLFADWMAQCRCAAVIVRPERYVFGMAANAAQAHRLVRDLARQLAICAA